MKVLELSVGIIAGIVAVLPLYLAWMDLQSRLTPEGLMWAQNPVVLLLVVFGTVYAATGRVQHVVATLATLAFFGSVLADVDVSRYIK